MKLTKTAVLTLLALTCAACGGGGGSASNAAPAQAAQPSNNSGTVAATYPYEIPDSNIGFREEADVTVLDAVAELNLGYCAFSNIEQVIPVDFNDDDTKDLLIFVLCGSPEVDFPSSDLVHDAPYRNTILVLLSEPDGSYIVGNQELFGKNQVELGGDVGGIAGFFRPLENPNSGMPLISYIISRDDFVRTRAEDYSNFMSYQGLLYPTADGTYEQVTFDTPIWAQGLAAIPNSSATWDLLYGSWRPNGNATSAFVYRLEATGEWSDVSAEYDDSEDASALAQYQYLHSINTTGEHVPFGDVNTLSNDYSIAGNGEGIAMYSLSSGMPTEFDVWDVYENTEWLRWRLDDDAGCGRREIMIHNNRPYFGGFAWDHFALWYPSPDSEPKLLAMAAVRFLPNNGEYDPNAQYTCDTEMDSGTFMAMFEFQSGKLEMVSTPFDRDTVEAGGLFKQAIDVNNDGYNDWYTANGSGHGAQPKIWLNDRQGGLILADSSSLPLIDDYNVCDSNNICIALDKGGQLHDMNNDGLMDVLQWHKGMPTPKLHDYLYEQGADVDAYKDQSGYFKIWYGQEQ